MSQPPSLIREKSFLFALEIIEIYKCLIDKKEFALSRQLLKSGTSIGANIREAQYAESRADFVHKIKIALKEANETEYWLDLLFKSGFIDPETYVQQQNNITSLLKILIRIVNSTLKSKPLSVNR